MISPKLEFKFFERDFKDTLVLIPGWATDYRIFNPLDLKYNYLAPTRLSPANFEKELSELLSQRSLNKISLLGWSMGGFLAADFAAKFPDKIDKLILISIREKFDPQAIEEARDGIKKNKKAYLYKFYLNCFSKPDREGLNWFKKNLLKDYIDKMDLEKLLSGLDYLSQARLNSQSLTRIKRIRIFHGSDDKIAPFEEAQSIKSRLSGAEFVCLNGLGHIPFLNRQFKENFENADSRRHPLALHPSPLWGEG